MNIPDDLEAPTGPLFVESRLDFSFDCELCSGTGWARLIRNDLSARFSFKLSGNSKKKTKACNSKFLQNFKLRFTLN